jgi:hypothetical protein
MKKYAVYYWMLVILGTVVAYATSNFAHYYIGVPRGVPLSRFGNLGTFAQFFLMVCPFIFAAVGTGIIYGRRNEAKPKKADFKILCLLVGGSALLLTVLFWISTGWIVIVFGAPLLALTWLLVPPLVVAVLFFILFPISVSVALRREL